MNKLLLFHSFNNTKNADPFYDLSISAYKQILRNIEDLLLSDQIMISFDDGYKSILPAVDFAHELGFNTNVNIVTSKINKPGFLSDKDIKMLFNKRTLIGSHSHTHKDFSKLNDHLLEKELTTSKKLLEDIIEAPVKYLSLPYGGYSQNTFYLANRYFSKILISRPLFFKDQRLEGRLSIHKSNFLKINFIKNILLGKNNLFFSSKILTTLILKKFIPNEFYRTLKNKLLMTTSKNYF